MNNPTKFVYHCSSKQELTKIEPRLSTHQQHFVYAAKDMIISLIFATNKQKCFGDFSLAKGRNPKTNKPFICERYPNAFNDAYSETSGSIYSLNSQVFEEGKTSWNEEVVAKESVNVENELNIKDLAKHLKELEEENKLEIYLYPNRPSFIANDDSDLVEKAYSFYNNNGERVLKLFKRLHPHLSAQLVTKIKEAK